jgi:hypothetical protein
MEGRQATKALAWIKFLLGIMIWADYFHQIQIKNLLT